MTKSPSAKSLAPQRIAVPDAAEDPYAAFNDAVAAASAEVVSVAGLTLERKDFLELGGFAEGVLDGAEYDLATRLRAAGRDVTPPPLPTGPAGRWLRRRYGAAAGRRSRAAGLAGLVGDNRVPIRRRPPAPTAAGEPSVVVLTDAFPARSETFIQNEVGALRDLGWRVRVESSARPVRADREAARSGRVDYLEDDPPLGGLAALARLAFRHPVRCLRDFAERRRWSATDEAWPLRALAGAARRLEVGGEGHIHVHFAAGAALHALRLARLAGIGWSVTGHGYDVFREPRDLPSKLDAAALVIAPCEYTARHLRAAMSPSRRDRVRVIVMGVDPGRFRRRRPYPGGRTVVAVGRLVEKKGFAHLIDAARLLEAEAPLDRVLIAGDGPLRGELEAAIVATGLEHRVEIVAAWGPEAVRDLLERADLLAMPSVVAADGDRDAMPVVVKEAMAMELPVVASDEVGLPELVDPRWGRLVAPGDPRSLAAGIRELLELAPDRRAEMGRLGREHVVAHCDVRRETAKLAALFQSLEAGGVVPDEAGGAASAR